MARERSILASLTHPHIARLYDAGIAADGRPYLALEYVDGVPIDAYASAHALETRARVALVVEVARAVAHAHARHVVHRDLKPSNILVDADGHRHLLDFGIARLVDPELDGRETAQTQAAGRALTPDYASPEQIRGDAVGTATDIYSLGVVLFELLAGVRPYRLDKRLGALALAQAVAEAEPLRPSEAATDAAVARRLRGDLDAIVARALARSAGDRYATVDAFADDLERHLNGEPVEARPDSRWYRTERWVRRHRLETAIVAAVLVALLGGAYAQVLVAAALAAGTAAALWQRNRARDEAAAAQAARERAEQVKNFVASIFTQAVPRDGQGGSVTAVDLLEAAAGRVESDLAGQPEVAAELGALIGASFNELGEMQASLRWLPRAVALCTHAFGPAHAVTLQARWRWVEAANTAGALATSAPLLAPLLLDVRAARPPLPELLVAVLRSNAFVLTKHGHEAEAMAALHEAVGVATQQLGEASEVALATRASLSNTFKHFGHDEEALRAIEPALRLARREFGAQRPHGTLQNVERAYAEALGRNHRPRDAAAILRQGLADQRTLDAGETGRVRTVMTTLAHALLQGGCIEASIALYAEAEAMQHRLFPGATDEGISLAVSHALACALHGRGSEALAHLARSDAWSGGRTESITMHRARESARLLALAAAGRAGPALAAAEAALAGDAAGPLPATHRVRAWHVRAGLLRAAGDATAAASAAAAGVAVAEEPGCADLDAGLMLIEAARCRAAAGDAEAAGACLDRAEARWRAGQVELDALGAARESLAAASPSGRPG